VSRGRAEPAKKIRLKRKTPINVKKKEISQTKIR